MWVTWVKKPNKQRRLPNEKMEACLQKKRVFHFHLVFQMFLYPLMCWTNEIIKIKQTISYLSSGINSWNNLRRGFPLLWLLTKRCSMQFQNRLHYWVVLKYKNNYFQPVSPYAIGQVESCCSVNQWQIPKKLDANNKITFQGVTCLHFSTPECLTSH